ncbi:MAG: site-specific integrase [Candidatus Methanoperedens sp.]|nr:site-specific integrase [Candidatus Methanoperedens sp.]
MANVDDIHGISSWYQSAMNRLKGVSPVNKKLILQFLSRMQKQGATLNTRASRLNILIRMDIHFQKPLTNITETEFDAFLSELELDGYKPGYIANYQKSFKKFCRIMLDPMPRWVVDMKIIRSESLVQPHELITQEDVLKMIDSTNSIRNKALIAVLADSGMRIGAVGSLRIQNVVIEQKYGLLYISKTSNSQKTTGAKGIPITWSTGYLGQWLSVHPCKEDSNAPLWVSELKNSKTRQFEALSYGRLFTITKEIAKEAGITRSVHPHSFRHKAITTWVLDKLSEQEIKHRAGWSKGSNQMFKIYANFTDAEINQGILNHYGLGKEEKKVTMETCPRCKVTLPPNSKFCHQCSLVLDYKALTDIKKYDDNMAQLIETLLKSDEARKIIEKMKV